MVLILLRRKKHLMKSFKSNLSLIKVLFFWCFIISITYCISGCKNNLHKEKVYGSTMGTTYSVTYCSKSQNVEKSSIDSLLNIINQNFSTYISNSAISKANEAIDTFEIDASFCKVLGTALRISEETNGAFDCTVLPLVNAYGFGIKERQSLSTSELQKAQDKVNYKTIKLSCANNKCFITKANSEAQIDLSAIAKGYAVDVISAYLDSTGIHNYLVEIGGELRFKGTNEIGQHWRVGIANPDTNVSNQGPFMVLSGLEMSLATSGNYRNYYWEGDKLFTHSINPKTGESANNSLLSVTVNAPSCMEADAIATACMVMGKDRSIAYIDSLESVNAVIIYQQGDSVKTKRLGI